MCASTPHMSPPPPISRSASPDVTGRGESELLHEGYLMNTSDVLNKAADLIEERGWTSGTEGWAEFSEEGAPLCLEGGIQAALGLTRGRSASGLYDCPAYLAVQDYLGLEGKTLGSLLWWWNDGQSSAETVVEVLRAAAVIEHARENSAARQQVSG